MEKRLIPYSVHLPEDVFNLIKQAAGERKASSMVREAIVSFVSKRDLFDKGYQAGIQAAIKKIGNNKLANSLSYDNVSVAEVLSNDLQKLIK